MISMAEKHAENTEEPKSKASHSLTSALARSLKAKVAKMLVEEANKTIKR